MRLLAGVAGLALAVLHVGRHPATRRLSEDAVDACEYCERLTRDWETRVCRILFLDAVDADSHPMKIIRGTHDNVYYSYKERSFDEDFARAQGEEVRLTGGAGDGYCFDTNSIHAGELNGRKARYVVVVEFHSGVIEDAFSRHGLHFRSPFGLR